MANEPVVDRCPADQRDVYLHASAVNVSGKALVFLGHSTAGKSTISRLLSERYPIIADDKIRVFQKKNGDWLICDGSDSPSLKKRNPRLVNDHKKYPLLSVLRIFKSKTLDIKLLSPKETCRYLIDAVFEVDMQRKQDDLQTIKRWFAFVAEMSIKNEGWRLTFKKDKSIIKMIYDNFEEKFFRDKHSGKISGKCKR